MKRLFQSSNNFAFLALALKLSPAMGAACCGGGFASPSIIAGDHQTQFTATSTYGEVVVDNVDDGGFWRRAENHTTLETFTLAGATLITDRIQAGLTVPIVNRSRMGENFSGLGDLAATAGYEYLTDWDYNPYRPKGIGYLQLTLPTGKSRFESENGGLDARGNGFFALGAGSLLTKTLGNFDVFTEFDLHKSFSKTIHTTMLSGELFPNYGGSFGLGLGYNTEKFRLGGSLTWSVEDPIQFQGSGTQFDESLERYATAVLSVSYLATEKWAGTVSYIDQTWFGAPLNTSLSRSVALLFQRRWDR